MMWRVNFVRSKDAQKQLARTSLKGQASTTNILEANALPTRNAFDRRTYCEEHKARLGRARGEIAMYTIPMIYYIMFNCSYSQSHFLNSI